MACKIHSDHQHKHGANCGHLAIRHNDHTDYLHDSHLHFDHNDHIDEHSLAVNLDNNAVCTPDHQCNSHSNSHQHGIGCGHDIIPHEDHLDYLVNGHLHSPCADHCDNHGAVVAV